MKNGQNVKGIKKATMKDVAKLANVSLSTVSHVINGTASISEETVVRVRKAIEALNYSPNALARGLRSNKTNLIGVIIPDIANEYYANTASTIIRIAEKYAYATVLVDTELNLEIEQKSIEALIQSRVDGLIFLGGFKDEKIIEMADSANIPIVLADRHYKDYCSVEFDNFEAMHNLIDYLYDLGIRKIGYIGETPYMVNLKERYDGVRDALKEHGLEIREEWFLLNPWMQLGKMDSARNIMDQYAKDRNKADMPEVFIASSDMIAVGAIDALNENGYRIPEDIGVTGYDNITLSKYYKPAITTMEQNTIIFGETIIEMLMGEVNKTNRARKIRLKTNLIMRNSVISNISTVQYKQK